WRWRPTCRGLDCNHHRRTCFEEPDRGIGRLRRLIGVKPEVIQCAPANRVRVLVLRKRFRVPGNGIWGLSNTPWRTAISSISLSSIVCPAGMLRRSVETDVAYVNPGAQGHAEGLNSAVEVHVKQGILIVPYAGRWAGYF